MARTTKCISKSVTGLAFGLVLFITGPSSANAAPKYKCSAPAFSAPTKIGKDGIFRADQFSDCILTDTPVGGTDGLLGLRDEMVREAGRATQVHEGPVSEVFETLPAVRFDVTEDPARNGYDVTIRKTDIFATDEIDVFLYDSKSRSVKGGGLNQFLRKIDVRLQIRVGTAPHSFIGRITSHAEIEQPGFIPGAMFTGMAEDQVRDELKKQIDTLVSRYIGKM